MQVDPVRLQPKRTGKCLEAGIFKEAMLARRVIKGPVPALPPKKKVDTAAKVPVIDS